MNENYVIGLMSGTSLDGLDVVYCKLSNIGGWSYEIIASTTVVYKECLRKRLREAPQKSVEQIEQLSEDFGVFMAECVRDFIAQHAIEKLDLISSHGHTVFHQPDKGLTLQIGDVKPIFDAIKIPVVYDFRTQDVEAGGQGAPLVPLVDKLLFPGYDACLNLGGFSNISFDVNGERIAFDICPVNIVLNLLSQQKGFDYDDCGALSKTGRVCTELLEKLNALAYYKLDAPKSLAWEWVIKFVLPIIEKSKLSIEDQMRTFVEHIAFQIISVANQYHLNEVLITGGGAYNKFLLERLNTVKGVNWCKAPSVLIDGKEALAFALLGLLKSRAEVNVLASVTGCVKNHSSGRIYRG